MRAALMGLVPHTIRYLIDWVLKKILNFKFYYKDYKIEIKYFY